MFLSSHAWIVLLSQNVSFAFFNNMRSTSNTRPVFCLIQNARPAFCLFQNTTPSFLIQNARPTFYLFQNVTHVFPS